MATQDITYADKVQVEAKPNPVNELWRSVDAVEVKNVVNNNKAELDTTNTTVAGFNSQIAINTARRINVKDYGAFGDGTTHPLSDVYADLAAAQVDYPLATSLGSEIDLEALKKAEATNAVGSTIFFPFGTYLISGYIPTQLVHLDGDQAIIKNTLNAITVSLNSAAGIYDTFVISNLIFEGKGKGTGGIDNTAIAIAFVKNFKILECTFREFTGGGVAIFGTYQGVGTPNKAGGNFIDCDFTENDVGLDSRSQGEYINVIGGNYDNNNIAILSVAGNQTYKGINVNFNVVGFDLKSGANNGHSVISGCTINHNTIPLRIRNTLLGYLITDCNIFIGDIDIDTSQGIKFSDCIFGVDSFIFGSTALGCQIVDSMHENIPVVTTHADADVRWSNNKLTTGSDLTPKTVNYTQTVLDDTIYTNGVITITLLPSNAFPDSKLTIKNIGGGAATVDADGAELIDGSATFSLASTGDSVTLISRRGGNWESI